MIAHSNRQSPSQDIFHRRAPVGLFALLFALVALLSISGCVGLTGAAKPADSTSTPITIVTQPASQTVTAGHTATFSVAATGGSGTLTYQWNDGGKALNGATSSSYTTAATSTSESGAQFSVTVSDGTSSVTSKNAALTVTASDVAPSITSQPANASVTAGHNATFSVTATGTAPLTYQWMKNGTAISGATSSSYATPATAASDNGAKFSVTVTNSVSSATSNSVTLTVNIPPSITSQPASQAVNAGLAAMFKVSATGTGTLSYQWKKNGATISGATSASYTTPATTSADSGSQFDVTVTDAAGSVTSNAAMLTVNASSTAPSIASQPASKTVIAGQTATFSVSAGGTAPLSYQWSKSGAAISGATSSSYTTSSTTTADSGAQFTVKVSNSVGSVTSGAATLTVNAATFVLNASQSSLNFPSVNVGSNSTLSVTFTNGGNSNVNISGITVSGAGYTASGVQSGQILTPGQQATLTVTFAPSSTGSLPGTITVASNATNSPARISLSGAGAQAASHSVTLSWTASTSTVSGYNVLRSTVNGGPYTQLNSSPVAATTYTDSTVLATDTYYYVVNSVNSSGVDSADSSQVSATIP